LRLSFCIAFAVLTFAGILAQYTALCAAFFALVSSGLFLLYRFSRDISLRKLELTESEIRVFGKTGKLLKNLPVFRRARIARCDADGGQFRRYVRQNLNPKTSFASVWTSNPRSRNAPYRTLRSWIALPSPTQKRRWISSTKKFRRQFDSNYTLQSPVRKKRTAAILFEKSERSDS